MRKNLKLIEHLGSGCSFGDLGWLKEMKRKLARGEIEVEGVVEKISSKLSEWRNEGLGGVNVAGSPSLSGDIEREGERDIEN